MPKLIRLYIVNVAIGFGLAFVFTVMLIALDVAHLRHLVFATQGGWIAVVMLIVCNAVVFSGVQFAIAVMGLAERDGGPKGGRRWRVPSLSRPLPIKAFARSRR